MATRSLANSKGGVAKTTGSLEIAYVLAQQGKKVLLIDTDSQKSLTKNMNLESEGRPTIFAVLTEPSKDANRAVVPYPGTPACPVTFPNGGGIWLIPGAREITRAATTFDKTRDRQPVSAYELTLDYVIRHWLSGFEEIIIDLSPSKDRTIDAAFYASNAVIAPVAAEPMAIDGVQELLLSVQESNQARAGFRIPGQLHLAGLLAAKVYPDQIELLNQFYQALDKSGIPHFGETYIPYTTAGWKAPAQRVPIGVFAPGDAAAVAYAHVVDKLAA